MTPQQSKRHKPGRDDRNRPLRLAGVDVGGTFTDIAVWDPARQEITVHKLLTTPDDPSRAIQQGLAALETVSDAVIHGTTLVTNALIERRGARTGLITSDGYRDVLEIGTELRYDTFDLFLTRPEPLVPRARRLTVGERIGADGDPVIGLDVAAVTEAGQRLVEAGVESIAVAFFNSYRNPTHELQAVDLLRELFPQVAVCASSEIAPEIREYERFSTAVANAYVQPITSGYLIKLSKVLKVPLFIMLSDGGVTTARAASDHPIALVESGPAAGTMAAAHLAAASGWPDVVAFDMGGTTAKISLVHGSVPQRTHSMEVARVHRFKKGSGLPIRVPVIELIEIGAGGGSIASVDDLGLLRVGPRSAGAVPGPACYGGGGTEATVTDADLRLGYLSAENFLGGRLKLDAERSTAVLDRLGQQLGIDSVAVAAGISRIVNNNMATAARIHIAEQGGDPRRYRMIAFGGAGPVHAYGVARLLHIREIVFPRAAGVVSAIGMLVAPRSVEYTRSLVFNLEAPDWEGVRKTLDELRARAVALLVEAHVDPHNVRFEIAADLRYVGQGFEITVPVEAGIIDRQDAGGLARAFESEYKRRFDRILTGMPAEAISWRVRALSPAAVTSFRLAAARHTGGATKTSRSAYFEETGDFVTTAVCERAALREGDVVQGPALIEEAESTVVVGPSGKVVVDRVGNLIMTIADSGSGSERSATAAQSPKSNERPMVRRQ